MNNYLIMKDYYSIIIIYIHKHHFYWINNTINIECVISPCDSRFLDQFDCYGYDNKNMHNKLKLNLKGDQYNQMIDKFKMRQQQTSLQEALVYLKLREYSCDNAKALIFAKRKQRCIDGTVNRDGPPGFRKLQVLKPESKLTNGWLRGQKLKYAGTTGYTDYLKKHQSAEKRSITKYNQQNREYQQGMRKMRSKSTVNIDMSKPRESLEKISSIKEDASKQRENRNMFIEYKGLRLDQTTKNFFRDAQSLDEEGLIVKLGAFSPMISDNDLAVKVDTANLRGKSLTHNQVIGSQKREDILSYQKKLREFTDEQTLNEAEQNKWKSLIQKMQNDEKRIHFSEQNIQAASNPLILMHTKQLKKSLSQNQKKCKQSITQYSSFYRNMENAVQMQFLQKRKYSTTEIGFKKRRSLKL